MRSLEIKITQYALSSGRLDEMRRHRELHNDSGIPIKSFPKLSIAQSASSWHVKRARNPHRPAVVISIPSQDGFVQLREVPIMVVEGLQRIAHGYSCQIAANAPEFPYYAALQLDGIVLLEMIASTPLRTVYQVLPEYNFQNTRIVAMRASHMAKQWDLLAA